MITKNDIPNQCVDFIDSIIQSQTENVTNYRRFVLESAIDTNSQAKLVELLYKDIIKKKDVKYPEIDQSQGNITKFKHYPRMLDCIDIINKLFSDKKPEEVKIMNELHDMIIKETDNFVFGYRAEIEFLQITYNAFILTLLEVIDICICIYVNYLKDVKSIDLDYFPKRQNQRMIIITAKKILNSYKNGEWDKIMKAIRGNKTYNSLGSDTITSLAQLAKNTSRVGYILISIITAGSLIIMIAMALFSAIRELIYYFFKKTYDLKYFIDVQNQFLKESMSRTDPNTKAYIREKGLSIKLENISNYIETKILKNEKKASIEKEKANREIFSTDNINKPLEDNTIPEDNSSELGKKYLPPDVIVF